MRKIADMTNGHVLVEMTGDEWGKHKSLPPSEYNADSYDVLDGWRIAFNKHIRKLDLTKGTQNALLGSTNIRSTDVIKNIRGEWIHVIGEPRVLESYRNRQKELMTFDEWREFTLNNPETLTFRLIGVGRRKEIIEALRNIIE